MVKIVFLHGMTGSKENFKYLEKELREDFELQSFDLVGFGQEKKPKVRYDKEVFLSFIEDKINFSEKEQYILVGHSMGAMLAKEFTLKYPRNVTRAILINYPLKKEKLLSHWFNRMYLNGALLGKILCHTKHMWKYLFYPYFFIFQRSYFASFRNYFEHTYHSECSTLRNLIVQDNKDILKKIKNKVVFIVGEKDHFTDFKFIKSFDNYIIGEMGHLFFGYEQEIAKIIRQTLKAR